MPAAKRFSVRREGILQWHSSILLISPLGNACESCQLLLGNTGCLSCFYQCSGKSSAPDPAHTVCLYTLHCPIVPPHPDPNHHSRTHHSLRYPPEQTGITKNHPLVAGTAEKTHTSAEHHSFFPFHPEKITRNVIFSIACTHSILAPTYTQVPPRSDYSINGNFLNSWILPHSVQLISIFCNKLPDIQFDIEAGRSPQTFLHLFKKNIPHMPPLLWHG